MRPITHTHVVFILRRQKIYRPHSVLSLISLLLHSCVLLLCDWKFVGSVENIEARTPSENLRELSIDPISTSNIIEADSFELIVGRPSVVSPRVASSSSSSNNAEDGLDTDRIEEETIPIRVEPTNVNKLQSLYSSSPTFTPAARIHTDSQCIKSHAPMPTAQQKSTLRYALHIPQEYEEILSSTFCVLVQSAVTNITNISIFTHLSFVLERFNKSNPVWCPVITTRACPASLNADVTSLIHPPAKPDFIAMSLSAFLYIEDLSSLLLAIESREYRVQCARWLFELNPTPMRSKERNNQQITNWVRRWIEAQKSSSSPARLEMFETRDDAYRTGPTSLTAATSFLTAKDWFVYFTAMSGRGSHKKSDVPYSTQVEVNVEHGSYAFRCYEDAINRKAVQAMLRTPDVMLVIPNSPHNSHRVLVLTGYLLLVTREKTDWTVERAEIHAIFYTHQNTLCGVFSIILEPRRLMTMEMYHFTPTGKVDALSLASYEHYPFQRTIDVPRIASFMTIYQRLHHKCSTIGLRDVKGVVLNVSKTVVSPPSLPPTPGSMGVFFDFPVPAETSSGNDYVPDSNAALESNNGGGPSSMGGSRVPHGSLHPHAGAVGGWNNALGLATGNTSPPTTFGSVPSFSTPTEEAPRMHLPSMKFREDEKVYLRPLLERKYAPNGGVQPSVLLPSEVFPSPAIYGNAAGSWGNPLGGSYDSADWNKRRILSVLTTDPILEGEPATPHFASIGANHPHRARMYGTSSGALNFFPTGPMEGDDFENHAVDVNGPEAPHELDEQLPEVEAEDETEHNASGEVFSFPISETPVKSKLGMWVVLLYAIALISALAIGIGGIMCWMHLQRRRQVPRRNAVSDGRRFTSSDEDGVSLETLSRSGHRHNGSVLDAPRHHGYTTIDTSSPYTEDVCCIDDDLGSLFSGETTTASSYSSVRLDSQNFSLGGTGGGKLGWASGTSPRRGVPPSKGSTPGTLLVATTPPQFSTSRETQQTSLQGNQKKQEPEVPQESPRRADGKPPLHQPRGGSLSLPLTQNGYHCSPKYVVSPPSISPPSSHIRYKRLFSPEASHVGPYPDPRRDSTEISVSAVPNSEMSYASSMPHSEENAVTHLGGVSVKYNASAAENAVGQSRWLRNRSPLPFERGGAPGPNRRPIPWGPRATHSLQRTAEVLHGNRKKVRKKRTEKATASSASSSVSSTASSSTTSSAHSIEEILSISTNFHGSDLDQGTY